MSAASDLLLETSCFFKSQVQYSRRLLTNRPCDQDDFLLSLTLCIIWGRLGHDASNVDRAEEVNAASAESIESR
jgi:hypothetical protein